MQFLANENLPLDVVEAVRQIGHDVAWVRVDAPGSKDRDILHRAVVERRTLLTFDKDFGELAFKSGLPASCGVVLFRLQAESSIALATMVATALQARSDWLGKFRSSNRAAFA
jgi:predicted nuclease of predicted toxin-antitoxin system